jgi:membrane protease YdiL (CAAX protease family)
MARLTISALLGDRFFIAATLLALPVWLLIYLLPIASLAAVSFSWQLLLTLGLLFPVLEELVFRGLLQGALLRRPALAKRSWGITPANLITSLLFVLMHLLHQTVLVSALVFIPSLIFGELRDRFDSTRPAIFMHLYYNLGLLLVLTLKPL